MKPLNISRSTAMELLYCTFPILAIIFPVHANVVLYTGAVLIAVLNVAMCLFIHGLKNPDFYGGLCYKMVSSSHVRMHEVFMFMELIHVVLFFNAILVVALNVPSVSVSLATFTAMRILHMKIQRDLVSLIYLVKKG